MHWNKAPNTKWRVFFLFLFPFALLSSSSLFCGLVIRLHDEWHIKWSNHRVPHSYDGESLWEKALSKLLPHESLWTRIEFAPTHWQTKLRSEYLVLFHPFLDSFLTLSWLLIDLGSHFTPNSSLNLYFKLVCLHRVYWDVNRQTLANPRSSQEGGLSINLVSSHLQTFFFLYFVFYILYFVFCIAYICVSVCI